MNLIKKTLVLILNGVLLFVMGCVCLGFWCTASFSIFLELESLEIKEIEVKMEMSRPML